MRRMENLQVSLINQGMLRLWACSQRANHVPDHDLLPDWVCDLNCMRLQVSIATPVPITNWICAVRGNILFRLRWLIHAWLQRAFPKCTCRNHVPIRALRSQVLRLGLSRRITIQNTPFFAFQKPDLKELCILKGQNQAFKSGKGKNYDPKRLSNRDSLLCEQSQYSTLTERAAEAGLPSTNDHHFQNDLLYKSHPVYSLVCLEWYDVRSKAWDPFTLFP